MPSLDDKLLKLDRLRYILSMKICMRNLISLFQTDKYILNKRMTLIFEKQIIMHIKKIGS